MKGKVGIIIGAVILFLVGFLVGQLVGGPLSKKKVVLKSGQTLETKLSEINQKLADLEAITKPGRKGGLEEGKEYKFNLEKSPVLGNPNGKVKIVVWSDFQCPFCERMESLLEELVRANPDQYALYFKNKVVHSGALLEHEAGLAANAQGKFWEMNDLLFKNRAEMLKLSGEGEDKLKEKIYEFAGQAGVNVDQLKADLESHKYRPQIDEEDRESAGNQVMSTPSVFINGYFHGFNPEDIKARILEGGQKPAGAEGAKEEVKAEGIEAKLAEMDEKIENLKKALARGPKGGGGGEEPQGPAQGKEFSFDLTTAPVLGPKDAKVKLVIFSDFQCPYCEKMGNFLEEIQMGNPKQIAVYFKNFVVHETAVMEHEAAMAAASQGKFWEYHNLLFQNRMELTKLAQEGEDKLKERLIGLAREAKLNVNQFQKELDSHTYQQIMKDNIAEGRKVGVAATPSVFVNGYFYGYKPEVIKGKVEEELKK